MGAKREKKGFSPHRDKRKNVIEDAEKSFR